MEGLRQRKRQRTRREIAGAALRLFAERGFDHTTISDIAEAAEVSRRTFFAYFPSKEDVVFWDFDHRLASFQNALKHRSARQSVLSVLREWLLLEVQTEALDIDRERLEARLIAEVPTVAARALQLYDRIEDLLAGALAAEMGAGVGPFVPRMAAAAATAWLRTLGRMVGEVDRDPALDDQLRKDPLGLANPAFEFLEAGLAAVRRNRGT